MPSRAPPIAAPTRPPPRGPVTPKVMDVPEEALGSWSFWTVPEASTSVRSKVPLMPSRPAPAPSRIPPRPLATTRLPGDWLDHTDTSTGCKYYFSFENAASQWEPPSAYVCRGWSRRVDDDGQAFWICSSFESAEADCEFFYESDKAWQRFVDLEERHYWSCAAKGIRFFETSRS